MNKNSAIFTGLFILMILAFTIDPDLIYNFQNNVLGKGIVVLILLYLTMNNVTLGLLFTLTIILILSRMDRPIIEGFKKKKVQKKSVQKKKKLLKMKKKRRVKRRVKMPKKQIEDEDEDEDNDDNENAQTQQQVNNNVNLNEDDDDENGVDLIALEETFRVRNPSTIPISREQFRVRELAPFDNISKYYGGMSSLV
jgi:hypothetical protein